MFLPKELSPKDFFLPWHHAPSGKVTIDGRQGSGRENPLSQPFIVRIIASQMAG
jgi:hypothetical protein